MNPLAGAIAALVEGDLEGLPPVLAADHVDLFAAAATLPQLIVSPAALLRVLTSWDGGGYAEEDVRQWASFVRRGYVGKPNAFPLLPISIDYDADHEDLIVEIVGRLDEIGDLIDGQVSGGERQAMLRALQEP